MLMYLFMLLYLKEDIYRNFQKQTVFLALCGLCMGLGISCVLSARMYIKPVQFEHFKGAFEGTQVIPQC